MKCENCEYCPMATTLRWTGRVLGLALVALVAWFHVAHLIAGDGPTLFGIKPIEASQLIAFVIGLAGMLLGWRRQLAGGIMSVSGIAGFYATNVLATGTFPGGWVFPVMAVPGTCFIAASLFETCKRAHLRKSGRLAI